MTDYSWWTFFGTITATFVGAGLAFLSNQVAQRLTRRADNLAAGNVAMTTLSQQLGDYRNYARAVREELEQRSEIPLWIRIRPIPCSFDATLRFDFEKLGFVFDNSPSLMGKLAVTQRRYFQLAKIAKLHFDTASDIQTRISSKVEWRKLSITDDMLRHEIGSAIVAQQASLSELILEHVNRGEAEYMQMADELYEALRKRFGSRFWGRKVTLLKIDRVNLLEQLEREVSNE